MAIEMTVEQALEQSDIWHLPNRDTRALEILAEEVRRLRGLVGGTDDSSQKLIDRLEMLEVQAVREIAPGWVGIPVVEWDSIMGPNVEITGP